jgi:predicted AAA+ superfamily ATPase
MYRRSIISYLQDWKNRSDRKPLVLRGARQVGKTTAVRMFAEAFEFFLQLNMENPLDAAIFANATSAKEVFESIRLKRNMPDAAPGATLLFIDEIQASAKAMSMLRYFFEEMPGLHVIAAGSLLEAVMADPVASFPVGRVEFAHLFPLSFPEFLRAMGLEMALDELNTVPVRQIAQTELFNRFHQYALIGGMPEAVRVFAETNDLAALSRVRQDLLITLANDVPKYARTRMVDSVMRHCIETAPLLAGERIVFAGFGNSNYRSREVAESLRSLERALLLFLLYPTTSTTIPQVPNYKKAPRLQFFDVGLVNSFLGINRTASEISDLSDLYRGKVIEQAVGQELLAASAPAYKKPLFWVREKAQSNAEVDFLVQRNGVIIPVEVKSGAAGSLRSLHQFVEESGISLAVRLYAKKPDVSQCSTPRGGKFTLINLPYFCASKIGEYVEWAQSGKSGK